MLQQKHRFDMPDLTPSSAPQPTGYWLYRYEYARPGNPQGLWWNRQALGLWLPPLSADDPGLLRFCARPGG